MFIWKLQPQNSPSNTCLCARSSWNLCRILICGKSDGEAHGKASDRVWEWIMNRNPFEGKLGRVMEGMIGREKKSFSKKELGVTLKPGRITWTLKRRASGMCPAPPPNTVMWHANATNQSVSIKKSHLWFSHSPQNTVLRKSFHSITLNANVPKWGLVKIYYFFLSWHFTRWYLAVSSI